MGVVQAGFRKQYSTVYHIYTLTEIISNCLYGTHRKKYYCIFIDYQKAFDSVDRKKIWEILHKIGVSSKFIRTLKAMYTSVRGRVRVGSKWTKEIECYSGVKQSCKLSPLLFSLLINEVTKVLENEVRGGYQFSPGSHLVKALLFADDLSALSATPVGLQQAINVINNASKELGLKINIEKTKIIVFRKGGFLNKDEKWFIDGKKIDVVNNYKYLGFTMTTKLSGEVALAECVGKAKAKVYAIFRTLKVLGKFNISLFFKMFDAQVVPSMLYASEVWGLVPYNLAESVHTVAF